MKAAQRWRERLQARSKTASALGALVERAVLSRENLQLSLRLPLQSPTAGGAGADCLALLKTVLLQIKQRGLEKRLVLDGQAAPARIDLPLLKALARGRRWSQDLFSGRATSVDQIAKREGLAARYVRELLPLGFSRAVHRRSRRRRPPATGAHLC